MDDDTLVAQGAGMSQADKLGDTCNSISTSLHVERIQDSDTSPINHSWGICSLAPQQILSPYRRSRSPTFNPSIEAVVHRPAIPNGLGHYGRGPQKRIIVSILEKDGGSRTH